MFIWVNSESLLPSFKLSILKISSWLMILGIGLSASSPYLIYVGIPLLVFGFVLSFVKSRILKLYLAALFIFIVTIIIVLFAIFPPEENYGTNTIQRIEYIEDVS